ncbi:hypothetical protein DIT72_12915 [Marinobacter orientalis]|nr:hypothetical protein DIT72_12915 [Marinobacter orientalis]
MALAKRSPLMRQSPYHRPRDPFWYMRRSVYRRYMVREATSVFIGLWMLNLILGILQLSRGEAAWTAWLTWQQHPLMLTFSGLTLIMAMVHTTTWFAIAPKAMPKFIAGKAVVHQQVVIGHWLVFGLVSLFLLVAVYWGA